MPRSNAHKVLSGASAIDVHTLRRYCGELLAMLSIGRRQRRMLLSMLPSVAVGNSASRSTERAANATKKLLVLSVVL